jgi:hypothetical protein
LNREFANAIPDTQVRELFLKNIGRNFGTEYKIGFSQVKPQTKSASQNVLEQFEDTITFDATVINGDRKYSKPNLLYRGDTVLLIDHSLAIPVHQWEQEIINQSPIFPEDEVIKHCYSPVLENKKFNYERTCENWGKRLDKDFLNEVRQLIPNSWENEPGDLDKIFSFLENRPIRFPEISGDLRRILK